MKKIEQIKSELKPVHSDPEYRKYLSMIDTLVDCEEGSPEEELLELLSVLVEDYELKHYSIDTKAA